MNEGSSPAVRRGGARPSARVPVYILAGGRSSRFGSDKARAVALGRPLLRHVADALQPVASDTTVVADRAGKHDDLGFRTIADLHPGLGPLAGLHAALTDLPAEHTWLLLCPCDALVVRRTWLGHLLAERQPDRDAVVFRADRWQPMPGLYARSGRPVVARLLDSAQRSLQGLLDRLRVAAVPLPGDWPESWQANTPADLARFCLGVVDERRADTGRGPA